MKHPSLGTFQWKTLPGRLFRKWFRHQRIIFLLICLIIVVAGAWKGYWDAYVFQWSDDQKREYRDKSLQSVRFQEKEFVRMVEILENRQVEFSSQTANEHDIFGAGSVRTQ